MFMFNLGLGFTKGMSKNGSCCIRIPKVTISGKCLSVASVVQEPFKLNIAQFKSLIPKKESVAFLQTRNQMGASSHRKDSRGV